jgi:hypothetical protein
MAAEDRLNVALSAVAGALAEIPAPSMIIGGVAVIAAGVPRQTIDIDATVLGRTSDPAVIVATLARHGITPRIEDALQFARERQVLLLRHDASGVPIELSLLGCHSRKRRCLEQSKRRLARLTSALRDRKI